MISFLHNERTLSNRIRGNNTFLCTQGNTCCHVLFEKLPCRQHKFGAFLYKLGFRAVSFLCGPFGDKTYKGLFRYQYHKLSRDVPNNEFYGAPETVFPTPYRSWLCNIGKYNYPASSSYLQIQDTQDFCSGLAVLLNNHPSTSGGLFRICGERFSFLQPKHQSLFGVVFFRWVCPSTLWKSSFFSIRGILIQVWWACLFLIRKSFCGLQEMLKDFYRDGFDRLDGKEQNKSWLAQTFVLKTPSHNLCKFLFVFYKPRLLSSNPRLP